MLELATRQGALGLDKQIGSLEVGKHASDRDSHYRPLPVATLVTDR